ncbi:hypothetical protein I6N87_17340, partial [Acinetobacter baumannii]|nr:hypothetical protein [Acinetobacter baumannii]
GVHLKFSGHYRGINELEKVGLSGRLRLSSIANLSLTMVIGMFLGHLVNNK